MCKATSFSHILTNKHTHKVPSDSVSTNFCLELMEPIANTSLADGSIISGRKLADTLYLQHGLALLCVLNLFGGQF